MQEDPAMADVYAFESCPFRDAAHALADRSSIVRSAARVLWPAATRAERIEISAEGIEARTLTGTTRLAWDDVTGVALRRSPLGRQVLRIRGGEGRIDVMPVLPGYAELESRVFAARPVLAAA
jgi:hypothetical protein